MKPYRLGGSTRFEIVGTGYRNAAFKEALKNYSHFDRESVEVNACLIPEPDNPFDRNAVSIRVDGLHHIGYLQREVATEWTPVLYQLIASDYFPVVKCSLRWTPAYSPNIDGGGFTDASTYLPESPHFAVPINSAPLNSALIPSGRSTQVTKEEEHFDILFDYVNDSGEATLFLELRLGSRTLRSGESRTIVYVFLDGQHVGELSPTMGKNFEPILLHLADVSKKAVVLGTIKGSSLAAALTFRAARSEEISDEWLRTLPPPPGDVSPTPPGYLPPPAYIPSPEPPRQRSSGTAQPDHLGRTRRHSRSTRKVQEPQTKSAGCLLLLITWGGAIAGAGATFAHFA